MKMLFKVGIIRHIPGYGWKQEFDIYLLDANSTLAELPEEITNDTNVTETFGLREDQPEYDTVHSFEDLLEVFRSEVHYYD